MSETTSRPITEARIAHFRRWCDKEVKEAITEGDGNTGQSFCWSDYKPFTKLDNEGEYRWQFSAEDRRFFDIFELFEKVSDEFEIETLDHETFCVSRKEKPE